jgi:hypothetical protein
MNTRTMSRDERLSEIRYRLKQREKKRLDRKFGRMWHTQYVLSDLTLGAMCYCCTAPAVRRIEANTWGVVCEYDVCEQHAQEYDGKNVDIVLARGES